MEQVGQLSWYDPPPRSDVDPGFNAIRGLLVSIAVSLVFVWAPIAFIVFGTSLITGGR